jgi:hypothetical protein
MRELFVLKNRWVVCWVVVSVATTLAGCAGNGEGLDQNGNPIGSSSSSSTPLTATFESIQDNVFTPICTRCHIGASAPEGLQLDAAHSYSLLVGVPSVEEPNLLRVKPGDPTDSYIIHKLNGGPDIIGGQMPLGGPYLPQATIDVIAQWISDGAPAPPAAAQMATMQRAPTFEVQTVSPPDGASMPEPVSEVVIGFSAEVDAARVNSSTVILEPVSEGEFPTPLGPPLPAAVAPILANPATVLLRLSTPLQPGRYRVTLRGNTGGEGLADVRGVRLEADEMFVFKVESPR